MKAAVIYEGSGAPEYVDFPEPEVKNTDELLVSVKASAIKHLDKSRARGTHYSSAGKPRVARVIGGDGICTLADGTRVYSMGITGMLAERAVIEKRRMVPVPEGLDDATAAALPNAVIGAAMALKFRANIQPGDTVLINGATGFTGRVAVQIAKYYGAKTVIATGRNQRSLNELLNLGADEMVPIQPDDAQFMNRVKALHQINPVNVVIDYLWGHTAELILSSLKGDGSFSANTRYVSVGSMTGDLIQLSAATLKSVNLQLSGSGLGSWTKAQVDLLFSAILPEMFQLAASGRLKIQTSKVKLADIAGIWNLEVPDGHRLVVMI
ncbi:quinone oxidoreductase family protein [Mucilaginibacter gotjawali]|uniref:Phenolphthiocerol synthesis polyketide synthase type I Pks15/1 n=2 Tax=Mucilaginibacter gotjawali TaxID=1550579 RepID=A0A120MXS3_9SPHI|nr:zinc-binding dehydrogenase [Mucilaginibacter gotjawali]MBB3058046.1 NADPH:quinone reductase-like Zn-dependent oxidoreductase [Mucilaginibacter gotjawali]BAU52021.1 Phenolphthiocerol synthesis polyketide synthase type I Pks15/1 [Mucilaginibacter gotjawali]